MERCGDYSETDCLQKEVSPDSGTTADCVSTCGCTQAGFALGTGPATGDPATGGKRKRME